MADTEVLVTKGIGKKDHLTEVKVRCIWKLQSSSRLS